LLFKNACKSLLFSSMVVLHVHRCSRALSSNCRQFSEFRRTGQAIQQLYGFAPYISFAIALHQGSLRGGTALHQNLNSMLRFCAT